MARVSDRNTKFDISPGIEGKLEWEIGLLSEKAFKAHKKGDYATALKLWNEILGLEDELPEAWYCKGITLRSMGKEGDVKKCFEEAIKRSKKTAAAFTKLGDLEFDIGDKSEAIKLFDEALKIDKTYTNAIFYKKYARGALEFERKNYKLAFEYLSEASKLARKLGKEEEFEWGVARIKAIRNIIKA